jgi:adenylyl-sulfate kinase
MEDKMEKGFCTWFTGVPASGKSTVGKAVVNKLREMGIKIEDFDADEVRSHISPNLGYTLEARDENTKRLAFFASILTRNGISANIAAVSSLRKFRDRARKMIDHFVEIMVDCPLEECQKRDPKGLYQKAAEGKINDIAGMHQPFEAPLKPEVYLDTSKMSIDECADTVIKKLRELNYIPDTDEKTGYSESEEEKVKKRLENLGYM